MSAAVPKGGHLRDRILRAFLLIAFSGYFVLQLYQSSVLCGIFLRIGFAGISIPVVLEDAECRIAKNECSIVCFVVVFLLFGGNLDTSQKWSGKKAVSHACPIRHQCKTAIRGGHQTFGFLRWTMDNKQPFAWSLNKQTIVVLEDGTFWLIGDDSLIEIVNIFD